MIKLLVYNIAANYPGYGDYVRIDKLRDFLIQGDWDIIGLNEVYNKTLRNILLDDVNLQDKYPYMIDSQKEWSEMPLHTFENGLIILSKYPIVDSKRFEYTNRLTFGINKILPPKDMIYCKVQIETTPIEVFFTHLQWGDDPRQVKVRLEHMQELRVQVDILHDPHTPTIVCGDMNIYGYPDKKDEYQHFMKLFNGFTDVHNALHPDDPALTWHGNNTKVFKWFAGEKYDYILTNDKIKGLSSTIIKPRARVGPYIMKWKPTENISIINRMNIDIKRLVRAFTLPFYFILLLVLTGYRVVNGYDQILFRAHKDLSDHYALEGIIEIE
ncbi:MAG: endonuclease/exonuclease/phosphatase family protein [Candidatus Heimdallarchaeota archaeon]|nr:endonuclease/exonuclease/phosphatase family protein [Candidatus Heimdallarchaeota archaeon]